MHAADDFASREQARNDRVFGIDNRRVRVNLHAAHGVVNARGDFNRVIRRYAQVRIHARVTLKVGVVLVLDILIPVAEGFGQRRRVDVDKRREFLNGVGLHGDSRRDIFFDGFQSVSQMLVENQVGVTSGLFEFGGGYHVTRFHLVDKTLALLIDQNRAVAAHAFRNEHTRALLHGRVKLDLVNIHESRADFLRHDNAVAGNAGGAGRDGAFQVGPVLHNHILIVAESARCQDDFLGVDGVIRGFVLGLDARHNAVFGNQFGRLGVVHNLNAQVVHLLQEARHQIRAHAGTVLGGVNAGVGRAAGEGDLRQRRADTVEPVDTGGGVLRHDGDKGAVVQLVSALHGVFDKLVYGVLNALLFLVMGFRRVHAARGLGRITAGVGHFFEQKDVHPGLFSVDSRGHARAARADDDNIRLQSRVRLFHVGGIGFGGVGELGQIRARLRERLTHGPENRAACDRRARERVDVRTLRRENPVA